MQGTIDGISGEPHRSQVFRLTYKGQDYQLVLLKKSLSKLDTELPISLDGIDQKIVKKGDHWFFENRHSDQHFATEIWRNFIASISPLRPKVCYMVVRSSIYSRF